MIKVGLLTLPFNFNYGGVLQGYALKSTLEKLGTHVTIISRRQNRSNIIKRSIVWSKWESFKILQYSRSLRVFPLVSFEHFKRKNINEITPNIFSDKKLNSIVDKHAFDAYVVGSDQVWNINASPNLYNHYLSFVTNPNAKKVAYAASFGKEEWLYPESATEECSKLAKNFDAISVREDSGVKLCREYLGVNAAHMVDPTMLLNADEYRKLYNDQHIAPFDGKIFTYILDENEDKRIFIEKVCSILKQNSFDLKSESLLHKLQTIKRRHFPTIETWLKAFNDSDYIITDSFHGTIFSIIFNKPFIAIANKDRGLARFESLLKMFQLENRLVENLESVPQSLLKTPIDWDNVNNIVESRKQMSIDFLKTSLFAN
ncbi:polysaccharide pyruvyl transferase family protein [Mangrovibacterium diazotrophicum]|uniref:Polysaccharide pyruvyl transferase n=1 Tax=Mangrovibacterium diazotrophicum TaxID=1261403 RepID=A0A419VWW0_9BACT|nr:polysaccharide pyruvyl transferase family protein [Mangrovibacterium diazotrophicum]RKD87723.1 polysaccharide pyruvyl transferase [Mangrovibacterium diazotrophicum]